MNDTFGIQAAQAALDAHMAAANLVGDDDATKLYHLLYSLMEFCAAKHISFDSELALARTDCVEAAAP